MKLLNSRDSRGDTIIEVVLAMSLLAFVLFSAWAITNRASQLNLTARQRVVIVNQLKEQAELLKSLNVADHNAVTSVTTATTVSENPCNDINLNLTDSVNQGQPGKLSEAMVITVDGSGKPIITKNTTKAVDGDSSQRVWIQAKKVDTKYVDFYVRSCWQVTGNTQKTDNSQFIVRINV